MYLTNTACARTVPVFKQHEEVRRAPDVVPGQSLDEQFSTAGHPETS